jgi:hypothetical protein
VFCVFYSNFGFADIFAPFQRDVNLYGQNAAAIEVPSVPNPLEIHFLAFLPEQKKILLGPAIPPLMGIGR